MFFHSTQNEEHHVLFDEELSCNDKIIEEDGRISLAYENLQFIPHRIAQKYGSKIKILDLSYNNLQNILFLTYFKNLHTLVLDHNTELDHLTFPYLPQLKILWLNNCNISNISEWIQCIHTQSPFLEQLSIMNNPGILKDQFRYYSINGNTSKYVITNYHEYIFNTLPKLKYLNGSRNSLLTADSTFESNENRGKVLNFPLPVKAQFKDKNSYSPKISSTCKLSIKNIFKIKQKNRSDKNS